MLEVKENNMAIYITKNTETPRYSQEHFVNTSRMRMPKVNVIDCDNEIMIKAELPGVSNEDIDVSVTNNILTIKAGLSKSASVERCYYYRSEIPQGSFSRSLSLPAEVDIDNSQVSFTNGLLDLRLLKINHVKHINDRERIET